MIDHRIIDEYLQIGSVKGVADSLDISVVKVRRTLITAGLWRSRSSEAIRELYEEGLTVDEIAQALCISPKGVEAYLPYREGPYCQEERSADAERCDHYRKRKRHALDVQVNSSKPISGKTERGDNTVITNGAEKKTTVHLHMELMQEHLADYEALALQTFGKVKSAISRDVLVPSSMTLHALHYLIQRAFGWQNSHLHNFVLPESIFAMLTTESFRRWGELCGIYFRMPTDDWEDLYWDDDYDGSVSFRTWLRRKYQGPYYYDGVSELYVACQRELMDFYKRWKKIDIRVPFEKILQNPDCDIIEKTISPKAATVDEIYRSIDLGGDPHELLERLTIADIMLLGEEEEPPEIENKLIEAVPVTKELRYFYDYGDGWEIKITVASNSEEAKCHPEVARDERPVCIAQDGLNVMDDVGGIYGYCDFLASLHRSEPETREELREWARMQGWTGRQQKPENAL